MNSYINLIADFKAFLKRQGINVESSLKNKKDSFFYIKVRGLNKNNGFYSIFCSLYFVLRDFNVENEKKLINTLELLESNLKKGLVRYNDDFLIKILKEEEKTPESLSFKKEYQIELVRALKI